MLFIYLCKILIDKPTRITETSATLLDHIITNDINNKDVNNGIAYSDISDHLAVFAIIPTSHKCNLQKKTHYT